MGHAPQPASYPVSIPVIDFTAWSNNASKEERHATSIQLVKACEEVGFAYIINHGVSQDLLDQAFAISIQLYDLPQEEKMKAPHPPGWAHHRGYSWPGLEKVSAALSKDDNQALVADLRKTTDCKESYEIGSDSNPDQPNIWLPPSALPSFRPLMTEFYWMCFSAASNILRALALGLALEDEDHLLRLHSGHYNQLRLLHYPPISTHAVENGSMARMPAHTDWSSMTMLFQDECGGLEIEDPHAPGRFVAAQPIRGALVMNVGDLLMRWTNDRLKSTSHRVTLPPKQHKGSQSRTAHPDRLLPARYSIAYFLTTDPDRLIECLPAGGLDEKEGKGEADRKRRSAKYEPITQRDYAAMRARVQY